MRTDIRVIWDEPGTPTLDEVEAAHVYRVLTDFGGNKTQAAKALGVNRRSFYRLLARYKTAPQMAPMQPAPQVQTPVESNASTEETAS